ncbi:hypothetical protein DERF_008346 [Dermatophagoides farinae]|uniref:Uncharacterized protein n=1 Tax=Dermatophagoides farinae TaxID=6954 RepID=A0A922L5D9_DERFA|nr:hypothetical protein DERF_008346 [Dermatophagoides farinae]
MAHMYYHVSSSKGTKIYRLHGRNFYADIVWTPSSYDWNRLVFSVKLFKLMSDQYNNHNHNDDDPPMMKPSTERPDFDPEYLLLENVSTFLIMPTDIEVMVFFTTNEFCIINYFTKNCGRRSTRDLFGCDDDDDDDDGYSEFSDGDDSDRPHNMTIVNIMENDQSFNEPSNNNSNTASMTTAKILLDTIKKSTSNETNKQNKRKMSTLTPPMPLPTMATSTSTNSIVKNISTADSIVSSSKFVSTKTTTVMPIFPSKNDDDDDDNGTQPNETNLSRATTAVQRPSITTDNSIVESHEKRNKKDEIEQIIVTTESSSVLCHIITATNDNNNKKNKKISKTTKIPPIHSIATVTSNYDLDSNKPTNSHVIENHVVNKSIHHSSSEKKPNKETHDDVDGDVNEKIFSQEITCDIDCVMLKLKEMKNLDQRKRGMSKNFDNNNDDVDEYLSSSNNYSIKSIINIMIKSDIIHGHFLKNGSFIIGRIIFRALKFVIITSLIIGSIIMLIILSIHRLRFKDFRADIFLYIMLSFFTQKLKQT